ncbi:YtxH domain-containing protein [Neobacillus cucumis]|uniref:YtxH domain-containing protein n=1 Tax=Neobacillus cucumis TaxID=1740721 RepID=UPI00203A8920|nr:YtxH domain-containing protein [Neobacillus cucumis]MCM3726286.1 YtxH domain-containing protein [Neobacillus cucumis]
MTKKNQFWKGMLLGAIAGGALSLLDKDTREAMKENVKRTSGMVGYIVRHPDELSEKVKGTAAKLKSTFETVSEDISFITEKVEELRELTPQVTEILKETKETFIEQDEDENLNIVLGKEK